MWYGVAWLVTGCMLAVWSLGAWALHAAAQWGAGFSGAKATGAAGALAEASHRVGALKPPEWLAVWLPAGAQEQWGAVVSTFTPWVEYALTHAPSLFAWLAPAVWVVWAVGGVLLLALGGGLSALIFAIKRRRPSPVMA